VSRLFYPAQVRFFFACPALKNLYVATAMRISFVLISQKSNPDLTETTALT